MFSDPYVCTIVITHAIYSINIVYTKMCHVFFICFVHSLYVDLCMPLWLCNSWFLILHDLSKVIFKISCSISNTIDLPDCEQIFTHLHLNLSGKAFKVGDQHFSSVSDTLNGLKYMQIKAKNLNGKRPSRHYVGRIVTFTFLADLVRFPCMLFREMPENLINL